MADELVWDRDKGELRILGMRQTAITAQALSDHLDSLVGVKVAEVIINSLEFRSGKDEAELFRKERPQATVDELINLLITYDSLTGVGITKVTFSENHEEPVVVRIWNPSVKGTVGASKAFLFSWWCGVLTTLLNRKFKIEDVTYDNEKDVSECRMVSTQPNES
jgi:hypothetical protein